MKTLRRAVLFLLLLLNLPLLISCGSSKAWRLVAEKYPPSAPSKPVLALISAPSKDKDLAQISAWATDQTVTLLVDADNFEVEDRTKTEALMKEKRLGLEGVLEGEKAVELGRLLSAKTGIVVSALVCSFAEIEARPAPRKRATPIPTRADRSEDVAEDLALALLHGLGEGLGKGMAEALRTATVSVSLKKVDLETGLVLKSLTLRAQGQGQGGPAALSNTLSLLERKLRRKLPELLLG